MSLCWPLISPTLTLILPKKEEEKWRGLKKEDKEKQERKEKEKEEVKKKEEKEKVKAV